ncbi:MAG: serine hydrolase domain-containing protein [Rikenellaceae bacterium]
MKKRKIAISIILICVIVNVYTLFTHIIPSASNDNQPSEELVVPDIPINKLLDNEMSSFETTERFDNEIKAFMRKWGIKGGSFALMRNDSLLYAKGYGYANVEDSVECNVNNVFRVASVSKLLTATAIMKLVEEGKISLESQVFGEEGVLNDSLFLDLKYSNLKQITVEHLLRHTAGFSSPLGDPAFSNSAVARYLNKPLPLTVNDMVVYATKNRLLSRPGGSYRYSNLGYILLGKIVEKVSDISYESFVQDSILAPAGCYDIALGHNFSEDRVPNEVRYYEVEDAEPVEAFDGSGRMKMKSDGGNNVTLLAGAGGWVASPTELLKFVAAIDGYGAKEEILSDETIKTMTYDSKTKKPIGWATVRSNEWLRSGSMAGTSALIKKQKNGYTWVFLSNSSSWNGPYLSRYMSTSISNSLARVKEWPKRDLFETKWNDTLMAQNPIISLPHSDITVTTINPISPSIN